MIYVQLPASEEDETLYPLGDCISCPVTENLNVSFELRLSYPLTGENFDKIVKDAWIKAQPNPYEGQQFFQIYSISKPINGIVTVRADHASYVGGNAVCRGRTDHSAGDTANELIGYLNAEVTAMPTGAITYATDITGITAEWDYTKPTTIRQIMADAAKLYGGMWYLNNRVCTLKARRGTDRGFTVQYGVNAVTLTTDRDYTAEYTHICPYWIGNVVETVGGVETMTKQNVFHSDKYLTISGDTDSFRPYMLDCTDQFIAKPADADLANAASAFMTDPSNKQLLRGKPLSVTVDFVALKKTAEYVDDENYSADSDRVEIGDSVAVSTRYGENESMICTGTVYDAVRERYTAITLGYLPTPTRAVKKEYISGYNKATSYTIADTQKQTQALQYAISHPDEKIPDKIVKVSDNEVYALYGTVKETWKADGTDNERRNFRKIMSEVTP